MMKTNLLRSITLHDSEYSLLFLKIKMEFVFTANKVFRSLKLCMNKRVK